MKKAAGFTLIELLLVLVLIGVGSGLAIVSADRLAQRVQERHWLDQTQQVLYRLRNKAVLSGRPVQAAIDFGAGILSERGRAVLQLPQGFYWRPAASVSSVNEEKVLALVFFPDGTMQDARFILALPSGAQQEFHLERISGLIERLEFAAQ